MCLFFFFKHKTSYEMRISDWSSDVCSSDLDDLLVRHRRHVTRREDTGLARRAARVDLDLAAIAQCHRIAEPFGVWDQADLDENPFEIGRASCRERVCQFV